MLASAAPFPQVGSYALLIDMDQPAPQPAELVRIQFRHLAHPPESGLVTVAFPLRNGADGTKRVRLTDLIDATPLTSAESREMTDLRRELAARGATVGRDGRITTRTVRGRKVKAARYEALRDRAVWAPHFTRIYERAVRLQHKAKAA